MYSTPSGLVLSMATADDAQDICNLKGESWASTDRVSLVRPSDVVKWIETSDAVTPKQLIMVGVESTGERIGLFKLIPIDWQNRSAAVGWDVYAHYRGTGLGTRIVQAGVYFATTVLGLVRLEAHILKDNIRSIRCAQAAGFVKEGTRRKALIKNGQRVDSFLYGLIR